MVKERYAVLKLRSALSFFDSIWVLCGKFFAATFQPIMTDLPKESLAYQAHRITNTGVQTFWPILRHRSPDHWEEVGISLHLSCGLHIQVVSSMNTSSCVRGVERFVSRRVRPLWFGQILIRTLSERRKSSVNALKRIVGLRALRGGSIRPLRHTKLASEIVSP